MSLTPDIIGNSTPSFPLALATEQNPAAKETYISVILNLYLLEALIFTMQGFFWPGKNIMDALGILWPSQC